MQMLHAPRIITLCLLFAMAEAACPSGCKCSFRRDGECASVAQCPCGTHVLGNFDCVFFQHSVWEGYPRLDWLSAIPASARQVDLLGCGIKTIPDGSFAHLAATRVLNLEYNALTGIAAGAFKGMAALKVLWITGHHMRPDDTPPEEYKTLEPIQNRIASIHADAFLETPKLTVLLAHHNRLGSLPDLLFKTPAKALRVLKLLDNRLSLKRFEGPLAGLEGVHQLDLDNDSGDFLEDWMEQQGHYLDDDNGDSSQWWEKQNLPREDEEDDADADNVDDNQQDL